MTCISCKEAFNSTDTKLIAGKVDNAGGAECCGCEKHTISEHSPGVVTDHESLIILICDPSDVLSDGHPSPRLAIQMDRAGKSSLRDKAHDEEIEITYELLKDRSKSSNSERYLHGFCVVPAIKLRFGGDDKAKVEGRFLCIYDTAYDDRPHHADIFGPDAQRVLGKTTSQTAIKKFQKERIRQIIEEIGPIIPVSQFRGGIFVKHARTQ